MKDINPVLGEYNTSFKLNVPKDDFVQMLYFSDTPEVDCAHWDKEESDRLDG